MRLWATLACALSVRLAEQALEALESPGDITRVITSLEALQQGVVDETKARLLVMNGQKSWCEDTIAEKKKAIEDAKDSAEQATTELQQAESEVSSSTAKVEEVKRSISTASTELSELEKKFDSKKASYKEALKKLTEARSDVEASLLGKSSAVAPVPSENLQKLRSLDSQLLRGASPPSFLQLGTKSATAMTNAEDDMEKEKEQLDSDWLATQKEAAGLMGAKKKEIMDLESDLQAAQLTVGMKQTSVAGLTRTKASMERIGKREGEILVGIEASCEANAKFNGEQEEMRSEQAAELRKGIMLLKSMTHIALVQFTAPAFVQLSEYEKPSQMATLFTDTDADADVALPPTTAEPVSLAQATAGLDPLAEVKAKIEGMLAALKAAENAEKGPADFCSTELGTNREKKLQKSDDVDRAQAEIRSAELKQQEFSNTQSGATLGRNALAAEKARVEQDAATEKDRIAEEKKDHDLAIEVLDKAVSLVNEEFTSMLQTNAKTSKEADAGKVVTLLNKVRDSISQQSGAAETFLTQLDSRIGGQVTKLDEAVRARDQEISEAKAGAADQQDAAAQAKESRQTAQSELASIITYLENLGQQCGPSLGNSYEELKRQREEEINGLKEALKVLEGEAVPALSMAQASAIASGGPLTATQRAALAIGV
jgi:DNA repair exonuclease SbcCD ATPase subunit